MILQVNLLQETQLTKQSFTPGEGVILSIRHKLVYDVVKNRPLFGILPLCPCKSIGRCISETGHLDTPVMLGTNKNSRRPTSS